jgi:hypothetical protein
MLWKDVLQAWETGDGLRRKVKSEKQMMDSFVEPFHFPSSVKGRFQWRATKALDAVAEAISEDEVG